MQCPFCGKDHDKVIDSRSSEGGRAVRRRRECLECHRRVTTYERVEDTIRLTVVKRDGSRVPYNRSKVLTGLQKACYKRNVSGEQLPENVVFQITGSGTPSEEREKRLAEIQALQALLQTEEVARAFGGKPSDITAIRERIVRLGGILDTKTYLPDSGGTAGTAQGVPSGPAGGPPIQGAAGPVSAAPSA